jgi:hypothetical protein
VAPRQASCAGTDAANAASPTTRQTPMTTATPATPSATPATWPRVSRSLRTAAVTASAVQIGVLALRMADSPDGRRVPAQEYRRNGARHSSEPTTARCPHSHRSRGHRVREITTRTASAAAPSTIRPTATPPTLKPSRATLMSRKLLPQVRASRP